MIGIHCQETITSNYQYSDKFILEIYWVVLKEQTFIVNSLIVHGSHDRGLTKLWSDWCSEEKQPWNLPGFLPSVSWLLLSSIRRGYLTVVYRLQMPPYEDPDQDARRLTRGLTAVVGYQICQAEPARYDATSGANQPTGSGWRMASWSTWWPIWLPTRWYYHLLVVSSKTGQPIPIGRGKGRTTRERW